MYNCPQCNSPFEKEEKVCKTCSFNLEKDFIYDPICPVCGTQYKAGTKRCKFDSFLLIDSKDFVVKCARCGASYPFDVAVCPADGNSVHPKVGEYKSGSDSNYGKYGRYSKIKGYIYPKASLGSRYMGINVDGFITLLLAFPAFIITYTVRPDYYSSSDNILGMICALFFLIPLVYFFIKDGLSSGQSWGKKSCRLMVVNLKTNKPCSKRRSALRNLFLFIPYINIIECIMVLANSKGQRMGDLICNTQVIETWHYAPELNKEENKKSAL